MSLLIFLIFQNEQRNGTIKKIYTYDPNQLMFYTMFLNFIGIF